MYPPIFDTCAAVPAVTALLGSSPTRLYPFDEAPKGVAKPYAVWQQVTGSPENYLDKTPDMDSYSIQVDVYSKTVDDTRAAAKAIRDAIESHAHVTFYNGEGREPDTNLYRYSFTVDWFVSR